MECPFCGDRKIRSQNQTFNSHQIYTCAACGESFTNCLDPNFDLDCDASQLPISSLKTKGAIAEFWDSLFKFICSPILNSPKLKSLVEKVFCGFNSFVRLPDKPLLILIALALAIALWQIMVVCLMVDVNSPNAIHAKLCQWDSGFYLNILNTGYRSTVPPNMTSPKFGEVVSNVAFFPGYPAIAWVVQKLSGLTSCYSLLVTSWLACWTFWIYILLFLRRWHISLKLSCAATLAISIYPSAFYLIIGYSEALFLMALLGFLYWVSKARVSLGAMLLAATHGFLLTATRIVGIPLAIYPIIYAFVRVPCFQQKTNLLKLIRQSGRYILIAEISLLGSILFFVFCHLEFGQWHLYMESQFAGWGLKTDYLAIFDPKSYALLFPIGNPDKYSRLSVTMTMATLLVATITEAISAKLLAPTNWQQRCGFHFCAWVMFYISVSGLASLGMRSMIRYTFPVYIMLVMTGVHLVSHVPRLKLFIARWIAPVLMLIGILFAMLQGKMLQIFLSGGWVA
jgi:hypothetical protein